MGWFSHKNDPVAPPMEPEQPNAPEPPARDDLALMPDFDDVFASAPRPIASPEPLSLQGLLPREAVAPIRVPQPAQSIPPPIAQPARPVLPQPDVPKPIVQVAPAPPQPVALPAAPPSPPPQAAPAPPVVSPPPASVSQAPPKAEPTPDDLLRQRRELRGSVLAMPTQREGMPYVEGAQYLQLLESVEAIRLRATGALHGHQLQLAAIDHADAELRQIILQLSAMWEEFLVIEESLSESKR